ncbi:MAG TPA: universal stress protein [Herpetosiphonaceae bacterium]
MHVLVIHDIAGRHDRLEALHERERLTQVDAVLLLGSLLARQPAAQASGSHPVTGAAPKNGTLLYQEMGRIFDTLGLFQAPVYLIPGEHDPSVAAVSQALHLYQGATRLHLIHRTAAPLGVEDVVAGFGGLLTTTQEITSPIQFPAWEARVAFEHLSAYNTMFKTAHRRIFLFATPPRGKHIDLQGGMHVGVQLLNYLIGAYQPHLVCCGGPASGRGIEVINGAHVVNPGSLADGSYAIADLDHDQVRVELLPEPIPSTPTLFRSITVALDGSLESWRALELAAGLAHTSSAQLTLVYAFESVRTVLGEPYLEDTVGKRIAQGEHLLESAAFYVADLLPQCEVVEGPAAEAILRVSEAHGADLIVMGSRGMGSISSILGSVSRRVLQQASCPVLIARHGPQNATLLELSARQITARD